MEAKHPHFEGKEAIRHVVEAQTRGLVDRAEIHGAEMPGHISAAADAAKDISMALLLLWYLCYFLGLETTLSSALVSIFAAGLIAWKTGRGAWLAWARLERLHRLVEEERWEIENHRDQEREELKALYAAKGFEGEMLEDVVDVLMADGDRLLRVMLEEEMGLTLEVHEHPLKQGLGAALGGGFSLLVFQLTYWLYEPYGFFVAGLSLLALGSAIASLYVRNRVVPAIVWNLSIAAVALGTTIFLLENLRAQGA